MRTEQITDAGEYDDDAVMLHDSGDILLLDDGAWRVAMGGP